MKIRDQIWFRLELLFNDPLQSCLSGCYPFTDRDPFLIESCPHVYFIGNQDKFGTCELKGMNFSLTDNY